MTKQEHKKGPLESLEDELEHLGEDVERISENIEEFERKLGLLHPLNILATWFWSGKSPWMPGTAGTLAALPFAHAIQLYGGKESLFAAALLLFFIGIFVADQFMKRSFTSHDPSEIVIDEVAGVWLLLVALPASLNAYLFAFVVFRFFDILKPWPISLCDRKVGGGFGVMFDDLVAGIYPVILIGLFAMFCGVTGYDGLNTLYTWLDGNALF